jgi:hypothetical protein
MNKDRLFCKHTKCRLLRLWGFLWVLFRLDVLYRLRPYLAVSDGFNAGYERGYETAAYELDPNWSSRADGVPNEAPTRVV